MGKLTNIRMDDSRLPIFRFILSRNGIDNSIYSGSSRELIVNEMSNSALQNMWAGIDTEAETNYNNLSRYNLLNVKLSNEITNIASCKAAGLFTIINGADIARSSVITLAGYSESEALSWADKAAIADRILNGTATGDEITQVETEAAARGLGETKEQLATKQIENATSFRLKRCIIDGHVRRAKDQIDNATTVNSIRDIVTNFADTVSAELVNAE